MKLLVLTPFVPSPEAAAGFPRAAYDRLCLLASDHKVTLLTLGESADAAQLRRLEEMGITVQLFERERYAPGKLGTARKRARLLWGMLTGPVPTLAQEFSSRALRQALTRALKEHYDLLLVEHTLMAQYLSSAPSGTSLALVYSEHDVRFALPPPSSDEKQASKGVAAKAQAAIERIDRGKWARYERRACDRANIALVPTEEDKLIIGKVVSPGKVRVVPFGMRGAIQEDAEESTPRDNATLLFVGNFEHAPNVDAALWLASTILPLVQRRRPESTLQIVGKAPGAAVGALRSTGVSVTGEVPSVAPFLRRCTVFVAPLRTGGGTRMKVLEAMQYGAPIVATDLGAQGTGAVPGEHLLIGESAQEIAAEVLRVLNDPQLGARLGRESRSFVQQRDDVDARRAQLNRTLDEAVQMARMEKP